MDERSQLCNLVEDTIARWRSGEKPDAAGFLARHPEIAVRKSLALDLIHEEMCLRREGGETVVASSFVTRFPDYRSSIVKMLEVEQYGVANPDFAEALSESLWPQPGQEFHGFTIVEPLGRGALARVYLAREIDMGGRPVVVKVSQDGGHEAHLLGQLEHENIVAAHSVKNDPETDLTVICMPLLGTATALDLLDSAFRKSNELPQSAEVIGRTARRYQPAEVVNPESLREAFPFASRSYVEGIAWIGQQLAAGLAAAGSHGIVHRDIKPSNVLLAWSGRPMLLDFNLSAGKGQGHDRIGGTVAYMSPERLAMLINDIGPEYELDPRPDIFSLGVLLYELLTGRLPVQPMDASGTDEASLRRWEDARRQRVAPPSQLNRDVDAPLDEIVLRCLAADPTQRFQTAGELAAALAAYLSPQARAARWTRRHRRQLLVGGIAAAITTTAGGVWWTTRPPYHEVQYQEGLRRYNAEDYDGAIEALTNSIAAEPKSVKALFARGQSYYRKGEYLEAQNDYLAAAKIEPRGLFWFCAGCCGLHDDSGPTYFVKALEAGYDEAAVYCNLGICLERTQQGAGYGNFDQAIALNPNLQPPYVELTAYFLNLGQQEVLPKAKKLIERACEVGPLYPRVLELAARANQLDAANSAASQKDAERYFQLWIQHGGQPEYYRDDPVLGPLARKFAALPADPNARSAAAGNPRPGVAPPMEADLSRLP